MANIVLKNASGEDIIYKGITSIKLNTEDGSVAEFVESPIVHVIGDYVEFTLLLDNWNGTTYTITTSEYVNITDVQLGIPPNSSLSNARMLIQSCLTIPGLESDESSTTIRIGAVKAPTSDVTVAIWGLI